MKLLLFVTGLAAILALGSAESKCPDPKGPMECKMDAAKDNEPCFCTRMAYILAMANPPSYVGGATALTDICAWVCVFFFFLFLAE